LYFGCLNSHFEPLLYTYTQKFYVITCEMISILKQSGKNKYVRDLYVYDILSFKEASNDTRIWVLYRCESLCIMKQLQNLNHV
jgi:hypothetical protein